MIWSLGHETIDPQHHPRTNQALKHESVEGINKIFGAAPAHLDWELLKEYDPDCVIFASVTPSPEFGLKQSCTEVIPL